MSVEGWYIHPIWLDVWADPTAQLAENVESAIIDVCPKVGGGYVWNEAQNVADRGKWIAQSAENGVTEHTTRNIWTVLRVPGCVNAHKFVEGREIFDAQYGVGVDVDRVDCGSLDSWKANGWRETTERENFAVVGCDLPVAGQVDVIGVGDEVQFSQNLFSGQIFPFVVDAARQADEGGPELVKALAVVENAYTEDAIRISASRLGREAKTVSRSRFHSALVRLKGAGDLPARSWFKM